MGPILIIFLLALTKHFSVNFAHIPTTPPASFATNKIENHGKNNLSSVVLKNFENFSKYLTLCLRFLVIEFNHKEINNKNYILLIASLSTWI